ncbi:MAG: DUF1499 domain-containing protein [Deltaproteobacteria bacterium]|nr:DUF1499 domain-containing protein [Deltaproteobacteria bacterium]
MINSSRIFKPFLLLLTTLLAGCSNTSIGVQNARLMPCPASPNCVSTDATDTKHQIAPFKIKSSDIDVWQQIQQQVSALPKTQIVTATENYLHAECRSSLFGFIDDLEFLLRPEQGEIAIRSAARLGYSDLGVNRKRVESLRAVLTGQGLLE